MNKSILFLLHIPPPVHGSSVVGFLIKHSLSINITFRCTYINLLVSKNVADSGIVNFNKVFGFIFTWLKILISILRKRPRVCYLALTTTGAAFFKDLLLVTLLKIFKIKRVYHLHNKGVRLHQTKIFNRICYNYVFQDAEVILLSKLLYPDVQDFVPESKVHICPNGIPDQLTISKFQIKNFQQCLAEERQNLDNRNVVRVLFLSNLIESKGVFVLLEACALLKKKMVLFECIFVGGEGDITISQFKSRVNQLEIGNYISYLGEKYGEEKYSVLAKSDIFAFPTYYETFGLVNLEAMQYYLPIVSTFEGGIPDIVEDGITGFLIPRRNAEALAEKLELLIKNPYLRQQMGASGRKKYEREFTLKIFELRLKEILQLVLENK